MDDTIRSNLKEERYQYTTSWLRKNPQPWHIHFVRNDPGGAFRHAAMTIQKAPRTQICHATYD